MASSVNGYNNVVGINKNIYSDYLIDKSKKAKVTIENFYQNLILQFGERKRRQETLEKAMEDMQLPIEEVLIMINTGKLL